VFLFSFDGALFDWLLSHHRKLSVTFCFLTNTSFKWTDPAVR